MTSVYAFRFVLGLRPKPKMPPKKKQKLIKVHTAGCERGFSAQNHILTSLRNRLTPENQDMLMRVKLHGNIDVERAFHAWEEAKNRRI